MYSIDNVKIGKFLSGLIQNSSYKSARRFCMEYLKVRDGKSGSDKLSPVEIQNMQNRISQIVNGNKGVQLEDLPIFSELLGVSADVILSAGTAFAPFPGRKTNYSVAFSKDPAEWEAYVQRDDTPFLNPDEYNKTVIDYALEAGNYALLKDLMDKKHIWFVGDDPKKYGFGFDAGTSIKRRDAAYQDLLDLQMKEDDVLRIKMIALAIKNHDPGMLDRLRAREMPLLYTLNPLLHTVSKAALPTSDSVDQMIEAVAAGDGPVLSYFFEEYDTAAAVGSVKNFFVFPYAGRVLDLLIRRNRTFESKLFLEMSIAHNNKIKEELLSLVKESGEYIVKTFGEITNNDVFKKEIWTHYAFNQSSGFISYCKPFFIKPATGFVSNVIQVSSSSNDAEVQFLIDELRKTSDFFLRQYEEKEA